MSKLIASVRDDSGLDLIRGIAREGESEDAMIERVAALHGLTDYAVVDDTDIPQDRTFRNAWSASGGAVGVDMPKARHVHMARIRSARNKKLAALDVEQLQGKDVAAEKQRLRDLPQTFDLTVAHTPDALDALWPEGVAR